jgi:hypothetical protein
MPFVDDSHPLFAWRSGDTKSVSYMWQLSFPLPFQQSQAIMGDKASLKDLALRVFICSSALPTKP